MEEEDDYLKKILTLENSIKAKNKLQNFIWPKFGEFENTNIKKFKKKIFSIIYKEYKVQRNTIKNHKCKDLNLSFFRVRELSSFTDLNAFSEHSYPPINLTKMGRCNFPKNPVFYCSNDPGTSLMEVIRENNFEKKQYCISRWKIRKNDNELLFENYLRIDLPKENVFKDLNKNVYDQIKEAFAGKISESQIKGTIKYFEFLDESFINDNSYSLSATLAHESLFKEHLSRTDILAYPSRQSYYKGVNFAINPNFVDNNMYVDRFYVIDVNHISKNKDRYSINFQNYGIVMKNLIHWKKIIEKDEKFEKFVKSDFGQSFYESMKNTDIKNK